jgi:ketosteroid isomerase-like protein
VSEPSVFGPLTERAVRALNARDVDAFLELVSPEVEFVPLVARVEGGAYRGHDGVRRWLEDTWSAMEGYETSAELLEDREGRIGLLRIELRLRGRGSGVEIETAAFQVVELDPSGKIRRWRLFDRLDDARALAREWAGTERPRS